MSESCAACRARKRRREQREVETPDYAQAARRFVRALGKRAGEDVIYLPELAELGRLVDEVLGEAVRAAVESGHWSYGDAARALGISRQAVHKRFAPDRPAPQLDTELAEFAALADTPGDTATP